MGACLGKRERPRLPPAIPNLNPLGEGQGPGTGEHPAPPVVDLEALAKLKDKEKLKLMEGIVKAQNAYISQSLHHAVALQQHSPKHVKDEVSNVHMHGENLCLTTQAGPQTPQQMANALLALEKVLGGGEPIPAGATLWVSPSLPATMARPHGTWALSQFDALRLMHEGSTAVVWEAVCRQSNNRVALKLYDHAALCSMGRAQLAREVRLHSAAYRHPHVIKLLAVFTELEVVELDGCSHISSSREASGVHSTTDAAARTHAGSVGGGSASSRQHSRGNTGQGSVVALTHTAEAVAGRSSILSRDSNVQERRLVAIVQEMAGGGNLLQTMFAGGGKLGEADAAARVMRPLLSALQHLHVQGVVHRDIKPENVVFDDEGNLKLIDFGVAVDLTRERANTRAGTVPYMPPEVLSCPLKAEPGEGKGEGDGVAAHSTAVDVWAVGCLLYEMLTGQVAFPQAGTAPLLTPGAAPTLYFPTKMSQAARDLILRCLNPEPAERPSVPELMRHPFLTIGTRAYTARVQAEVPTTGGHTGPLQRSLSLRDMAAPLETPQPVRPAAGEEGRGRSMARGGGVAFSGAVAAQAIMSHVQQATSPRGGSGGGGAVTRLGKGVSRPAHMAAQQMILRGTATAQLGHV